MVEFIFSSEFLVKRLYYERNVETLRNWQKITEGLKAIQFVVEKITGLPFTCSG